MKRFFLVLGLLLLLTGLSQARDSLGMRLLGQTLLGPARQVVVQGYYAYVGVSCGLLILDISDPANPVEMGRAYDVEFTIIEDVFVQNGYAYLVDAYNGLAIVDVRDLRNPRVVGRVGRGGHMLGIWVQDTLAYMVGSNSIQDSSDLLVINVKDPAAPFVVAGYDTCWGNKIQVVDTLAYVSGGGWQSELEAYNLSDPRAIRKIGQSSGLGITYDLEIRDTLAFIASSDSGFCVVNIKNPQLPQKVLCFRPSGPSNAGPRSISVLGNFVYLCEDWVIYERYPYSNLSHLWVIDISNPASPVERGRCETSGLGGGSLLKTAWSTLPTAERVFG